jgi:hypothetical protein
MTSLAEAPQTLGAFEIERDGELAIVWFDYPG